MHQSNYLSPREYQDAYRGGVARMFQCPEPTKGRTSWKALGKFVADLNVGQELILQACSEKQLDLAVAALSREAQKAGSFLRRGIRNGLRYHTVKSSQVRPYAQVVAA